MRYAEVCVNSPIARRSTFSYAIPYDLEISAGQAVWVPFGNKVLQGIVLELVPLPAVEETREIAGIIDERPVLSPAHVLLSRWISGYYLSPLFDAVSLMLPPGFERKPVAFIQLSSDEVERNIQVIPGQEKVLELLKGQEKVSLKELERSLGKRKAQTVVSQLVKLNLVARRYELERLRVKPKLLSYLSIAIPAEKVQEAINELPPKAVKQVALLEFLARRGGPVLLTEVKKICPPSAISGAIKKGLVQKEFLEVRRDPISYENIVPSYPLTLTMAQKLAFEAVKASLDKGSKDGHPSVFLLHGITGSGKTEVYLQALAEVVKRGKRGIALVPEIALTPQTIERFASRFPHKVAVVHSALSLGEQYDEWRRIRDGEFDVVIGPRSALFAPQLDLGLIVIDEEHEWTYKQDDRSPRYHTRDVAVKLAELTGATVILGSATPDVETYYRAQLGEYRLLELSERVTPDEGSPLPAVEVVDMREELKTGNTSIFSRSLSREMNQALSNEEQIILFLNRRGAASFIQCRNCGFVLKCKRCDVPLAYHIAEADLLCHQCNYKLKVPQICPQCSSRRIKFLGIGTQKLEQETASGFPQAGLLRWDSDVTRKRKGSHQKILDSFRSHKADILIGTQMVAKGLDLPLVTLVGVVNADIALGLPDFRAGEKTFQLLSQVAGRAGRGILGGRVIIQTYSPEHYAVQAAARHDYRLFYNKEIAYRRELNYPPFTRLACLVYSHTNDTRCQQEAERMKRLLTEERDSKGIAGISIIGPAPAYIPRLRGRYRWQIILRGTSLSEFLSPIPFPKGWVVDIDPVSLV